MEKYVFVYMDETGRWAGLLSCLHTFETVRCIGWSVSVVYKVRDHETGDLGVMVGMLVAKGSWVRRMYLSTFAFGPDESSLYGG